MTLQGIQKTATEFRESEFPRFRDSGIPGFLDSGIPEEKKNLGFQGIPGIPLKKVADSTGIPGKKVADSIWESGSQLGICTPLIKSVL